MADFPGWWVTPSEDQQWDVTSMDDWIELAAITQPGSGGSYARDDAAETLVGLIPTEKKYDARLKILGAAWADEESPWALHRLNPLPHPNEEQLRAVTCDMNGYNPMGKLVPTDPAPTYPPPPPFPPQPQIPDPEDPETLIDPPAYSPAIPAAVANTFPNRINYTRQMTTIKFRPHPFPFLTDEQMIAGSYPEYYRNCSIFDSCDPILEVLAGTTPFLKWADIPASPETEPVQGTNNGLDKGVVPIFISKANLVMVWFNVPLDFIADPYLPSKIMAAVGKVNEEDDWIADPLTPGSGFPKGTLKLEAPKFKKSVQGHVRTSPSYQIPYVVDVWLPFTFVNPEPAAVVDGGGSPTPPTFLGHNLFAWNLKNKFYSVCREDDTGKSLFDYTSFDAIFTHVRS